MCFLPSLSHCWYFPILRGTKIAGAKSILLKGNSWKKGIIDKMSFRQTLASFSLGFQLVLNKLAGCGTYFYFRCRFLYLSTKTAFVCSLFSSLSAAFWGSTDYFMAEKKLFDGLHPPLCSTAIHVTLMSAFLPQTTASSQTQARLRLVVRTVAFTSRWQLQKYSLIIANKFCRPCVFFFFIPAASMRLNNVLVLFTAASWFEG